MSEKFMREALAEAEAAALIGEVPVGAVVVREGEIIARAHNLVETNHDSSAHAEMLAIKAAEQSCGKWLTGCTLYVTLEPCAMCAGAMILARIDKLCYGAQDAKNGACGSVLAVTEPGILNHTIEVEAGVLEEECGSILSDFFKEMRANKIKWRKSIL